MGRRPPRQPCKAPSVQTSTLSSYPMHIVARDTSRIGRGRRLCRASGVGSSGSAPAAQCARSTCPRGFNFRTHRAQAPSDTNNSFIASVVFKVASEAPVWVLLLQMRARVGHARPAGPLSGRCGHCLIPDNPNPGEWGCQNDVEFPAWRDSDILPFHDSDLSYSPPVSGAPRRRASNPNLHRTAQLTLRWRRG
jgi:hypothetical protein